MCGTSLVTTAISGVCDRATVLGGMARTPLGTMWIGAVMPS